MEVLLVSYGVSQWGGYLKDNGYKVFYNLKSYEKYKRAHDPHLRLMLLEAFPNMDLPVAKGWKRFRYRYFYDASANKYDINYKNKIDKLNKPISIRLYEMDWLMKELDLRKYLDWDSLSERLSRRGKDVLEDIQGCNSIGIHVRRGDMSTKKEGGYWFVLTPEYFIEAINEAKKHSDSRFKLFFMTEDIEFVVKRIIPLIEDEYVIVSDSKLAVYEELFLLSQCKTIISSQGSWGVTAWKLNGNKSMFISYTTDVEGKNSMSDKVIQIGLREEMHE